MEKVKARKSFGDDYECNHPWECFVQCGDSGLVLSKSGNYKTAFFEAFPKQPSCFLRGEGNSIEEAEEECWVKYQKVLVCDHEFERRNRTDGYAYCKHCSYSSVLLEPLTKCCKCSKPTSKNCDKKGLYYCEKHGNNIPMKNKIEIGFGMSLNKKRLPRKYKKILKKAAQYKFSKSDLLGKVYLDKTYTGIVRFKSGNFSISLFCNRNRKELIDEYKMKQ